MRRLLLKGWRFIRESVTFTFESTMAISAPPGALRLRAITWPKLALGGILGRLLHLARVPFELTPLLALPFIACGAYFLYTGPIWLGVLFSVLVLAADIADGVATGWSINHLPPEQKPSKKLQLRRALDTYVVDIASRLALYGVFCLLLRHYDLLAPIWLVLLLTVECLNMALAAYSETTARRDEFFYEFVFERQLARRRYGTLYPLRVVGNHLTAYHTYSLFPLLGYLWPLATYGRLYFGLVLAFRALVLVGRGASWLAVSNLQGRAAPDR